MIVGTQVGVADAAGNRYYHLYLHRAGDPHSIDLTPSTLNGVLFDGMTQGATKIFFTTKDPLLSADGDTSADVFEAEVDSDGAYSLRLVSTDSTGSPSNDDSCTPPGQPDNWNAASGAGQCDTVALAGGAGIASGEGTFYFFSPEELDVSDPENLPIRDQPNLYEVQPGGYPHFVATIDSSLAKPVPMVNSTSPTNANLTGTTIEGAEAMTVDQLNGDIYVSGVEEGEILRFYSNGAPHNFTCTPGPGCSASGNALTGFSAAGFSGYSVTQVAVDNSGGPLVGDIYVTDAFTEEVAIFGRDGTRLGSLTGLSLPCGVAVDQSNGSVFAGDIEHLFRYVPVASPTLPLGNADFTKSGITPNGVAEPCNVAADRGNVYATAVFSDGPLVRFQASSFVNNGTPSRSGTQIDANATAVSIDPESHNVYSDEGNRSRSLISTGALVSTLGTGNLSNSRGVAVNGQHRVVPWLSLR